MAATTTTALDIITSALRNINAHEVGEPVGPQDSADALQTLNDMIESWSIDKLLIFCSTETQLTFQAGQYQYSIGNAPGGTFTGTVTSGSAVITGVTVPSGIILNSFVTSNQNLFPPNSYVVNIGANTVSLNANALASSVGSDVLTYVIPGNFYKDSVSGVPVNRPVRITNAFTRITASGNTGLDYQMEIVTKDKYTSIGYKGVAGPWPKVLYYDPTYPLGTLYFYPNPSQAGVLHLWTDQILAGFQSVTQLVSLPQGYARALKKNLALELCPEYGKSASAQLQRQAKESKDLIKSLNSIPAVTAFFDSDIVRGNRTDASWIMHGGFAN